MYKTRLGVHIDKPRIWDEHDYSIMFNNVRAKKFPVTNALRGIYSALLSPNSAATVPYCDTVHSASFYFKKAENIQLLYLFT